MTQARSVDNDLIDDISDLSEDMYAYLADYGAELNYIWGVVINDLSASMINGGPLVNIPLPVVTGAAVLWNWADGVDNFLAAKRLWSDEENYRQTQQKIKAAINLMSGAQLFALTLNPLTGTTLAGASFAFAMFCDVINLSMDFDNACKEKNFEGWLEERVKETNYQDERIIKINTEIEAIEREINDENDRQTKASILQVKTPEKSQKDEIDAIEREIRDENDHQANALNLEVKTPEKSQKDEFEMVTIATKNEITSYFSKKIKILESKKNELEEKRTSIIRKKDGLLNDIQARCRVYYYDVDEAANKKQQLIDSQINRLNDPKPDQLKLNLYVKPTPSDRERNNAIQKSLDEEHEKARNALVVKTISFIGMTLLAAAPFIAASGAGLPLGILIAGIGLTTLVAVHYFIKNGEKAIDKVQGHVSSNHSSFFNKPCNRDHNLPNDFERTEKNDDLTEIVSNNIKMRT